MEFPGHQQFYWEIKLWSFSHWAFSVTKIISQNSLPFQMDEPQNVKFNNETEGICVFCSYLLVATVVFGYGGERWLSFTITAEFLVFHCATLTLFVLVILRTWPTQITPSSHNHVCSFYSLEIYKPNHDLRELNILLGKPPHPQSGILGCQFHCECMCSFLCV